jgi:hypothetical protein
VSSKLRAKRDPSPFLPRDGPGGFHPDDEIRNSRMVLIFLEMIKNVSF